MRYLIFILFSFVLTQSFAQLMSYKAYNHKDGLQISTLKSVTQSKDGLLWIGTGGGDIVQFDGTTFSNLEIQENSNFHINNITFNKNKILLSSTYTGFYSYDLKTQKAERFDLISYLFGESKLILKDKNVIYFLGSAKFLSKKSSEKPKVILENKEEIIIHQHFESPIGIVLFTNVGDFILKNGDIMKLNNWFPHSKDTIDEYNYGYTENNALVFIHQNGTKKLEVHLDTKNKISSTIVSELDFSSLAEDSIVGFNYNRTKKHSTLIMKSGKMFYLNDDKWQKIEFNTKEKIKNPTSFFSDNNGDYWITTEYNGLIKISEEPFTRIEKTHLYTAPDNFFLYQFSDGVRLVSNSKGKTFFETRANSGEFESYNFSTFAITYTDSAYFLATSNGLWVYDLNDNPKLGAQFFKNQSISNVNSIGNNLYIALSGKGMRIYDINKHTITKPKIKKGVIPNHIYTSAISDNKAFAYFGTNNGIYALDVKSNEIEKFEINLVELGHYSGISTKDIYGTCWFTVERGIVGITKNQELIVLKGEEYFNSTLFYTMMADEFGNLYIGTNKGITCLKVNHKGEVLRKTLYNENNNFLGYETNMRSQFRLGNMIYFGTIEGVFQINTELLENLPNPPPPIINVHQENGEKEIKHPDFYVSFSVNNPKIKSIYFQYRLDKGPWLTIKNKNQVFIEELTNGFHTIEAKSSFNGINYSKINLKNFEVITSFWSSSLFIALLIAGVFILNFIILNYYKKFKTNKLIESKDISFQFSLTPALLLFTAITTPLTFIIANINKVVLELSIESNLISSFLLFFIFFISLQLKKNNKTNYYNLLLKLGLFIISLEYLSQFYHSKAHPYVVIGLIIILSIVPYIYVKVKDVIIFTFTFCFIFIITILLIEQVVYPKSFFIYAISIAAFLNVFYSYLKYDSLEKLIFISTIINKGNMPVIAFDHQGTIIYASENISSFLDTDYTNLITKNIKILNQHIPFDSSFKKNDITRDFKDGEKYLVPMVGANHEVKWIEWAFKNFSKDVNLILGQDVSDKMELENTYELLVQQADDFIFKCDLDGNFVFVNNYMIQELGFSEEELINMSSTDLVSEKYKKKVHDYYQEHFFDKKTSSYFDFPILKKNGEEIWVGQSVTTLFSPGSTTKIDGFIALSRDITEVRKKNDLIREQSESITASINYARRIQNNLLPSKKEFNEIFDEYFIFSRPKNIVSGDFYWMENVGDNTILVLGDCTGHGVPGSFMTLLGFNLLNSTVLENRIVDPGQILNRIDQKLIEYLPRGEGDNLVNDAMELTICVFNKKTNEIAYACAGSRFLVYENESFTLYKGDNKHAGDIEDNFLGYNTHFASFENDFNLYLFSDGFQDQFGGVKDKKFSFRRLIELFESNINLPLKEQQRLITETFDHWIGNTEQTDDVTILSVKMKKNEND